MVKNPNWREAYQLAIYKRRREVELGATENNISQRSERDLNPRPTDFKSGALTTRPRCLHVLMKNQIFRISIPNFKCSSSNKKQSTSKETKKILSFK